MRPGLRHLERCDPRTFSQHATATEFAEIAERLTGRRVRAFISGVDTRADVCSEVFYLHDAAAEAVSAFGLDPAAI